MGDLRILGDLRRIASADMDSADDIAASWLAVLFVRLI